jgi:hypothetical protein
MTVTKTTLPIEFTDEQLIAVHNGLVLEIQRLAREGAGVESILAAGETVKAISTFVILAIKRTKAALAQEIHEDHRQLSTKPHKGNNTAH